MAVKQLKRDIERNAIVSSIDVDQALDVLTRVRAKTQAASLTQLGQKFRSLEVEHEFY